jgi:type II secretory pathway component PulK
MNDQAAGAVANGAALIPCILMVLLIALMIAAVVMWFVALIHAAISKMENQAIWLLVIILGGPIGALVYFIARPFKAGAGNRLKDR